MNFNLAKFQSKLNENDRDGSFSMTQNLKTRKLLTNKRKSHFSQSLLEGIKPKKEVRFVVDSGSENEFE
jgi:hypothetical protein